MKLRFGSAILFFVFALFLAGCATSTSPGSGGGGSFGFIRPGSEFISVTTSTESNGQPGYSDTTIEKVVATGLIVDGKTGVMEVARGSIYWHDTTRVLDLYDTVYYHTEYNGDFSEHLYLGRKRAAPFGWITIP